MRRASRIARLLFTFALVGACLADFGCSKAFRVFFDGDERGGRLVVDGPDVRVDASGGPGGGSVFVDTPAGSFRGSARQVPPYLRRYPTGGGKYPAAPQSTALASGPSAPQDGSVPMDYTSPLDDPAFLAAAPQPPGAPASSQLSYGGDPQLDVTSEPGKAMDVVAAEEGRHERAMFELINETRRRNDLSPLERDDKVELIAKRHSEEMNALGYFEHKSPVRENHTLKDRMRNGGVGFRKATENIARYPYRLGSGVSVGPEGSRTAQGPDRLARDMMDGYMNSPGHRQNILDPQVGRVGVGTVIGPRFAYNTQNYRD